MKLKKPVIVILMFILAGSSIALFIYIKSDRYSDVLPNTKFIDADISIIVSVLRKARDTHNIDVCNLLPEPVHQEYRIYDTGPANPAATREEWYLYCKALATHDITLCQTPLSRGFPAVALPPNFSSYPDLMSECRSVLSE